MNKYEALTIIGKLEIQLQNQERLLNEVTKLQECILNDDLAGEARYLGRLSELTQILNLDISENLQTLSKFMIEDSEEKKNIPIEDLDLSVRSFSCLKRAGINTLGDILEIPKSKLCDCKIRNLGKKSAEEIINAVEIKGFKMKD